MSSSSLPNHLHQHSLASPPVELPVEDLLPRPKVQLTIGHCHHDLAAHDLPLDVHIGIVFPRIVMPVLACRLMRRDLFQPGIMVMLQPGLVIVDEHPRRDVHGVYQPFTITITR